MQHCIKENGSAEPVILNLSLTMCTFRSLENKRVLLKFLITKSLSKASKIQ